MKAFFSDHYVLPLPDDTGDEAYLAALDTALPEAIERAAADLAIYLSGADPHENDRFGRLKVTTAAILFETVRTAGEFAR